RHGLREPGPGGGPARHPGPGLPRPPRPPPDRPVRVRRPPHRRPDRTQPGAPHVGLTAGVLAIDAGNSKTDVAVIGSDGTVLATARGEGFRPPAVGLDAAMRTLTGTVTRALTAAGTPAVSHVAACLANAD